MRRPIVHQLTDRRRADDWLCGAAYPPGDGFVPIRKPRPALRAPAMIALAAGTCLAIAALVVEISNGRVW